MRKTLTTCTVFVLIASLLWASGIAPQAYTRIQSGGSNITQRTVLNFVSGTTCVDNSGTTPPRTDCTSTGSGAPTTNQNIRAVSFVFDGGGSALSGSLTRCQQVNYAGTINQVSLIGDQSGSATVDVKTVAFGSYTGPGSTSSITAAAIPALSSAARFQDSTLTGWTTALTANTVVCFALSSPTTVTWVAGNIRIAAN